MEENNIMQKNSFFDKVLTGLSLIVVFLLPLFFIPGGFVSLQYGTSLLFAFSVIVSALIYIVSVLKKGTLVVPTQKLFTIGGFLVVPVVYALSSLSHGVSRMSFFGYTFDISTVGFVLLSFLFLFLVSIIFADKKKIFYSYIAIVVSLLCVSLFLIIRMIYGADVLSFGLFTSLTTTVVGGWNSTGIFFGIGAILSLLTYEMLSLTRFTKILTTVALVISLFFLSIINFGSIWIIVASIAFLFLAYRVFSPTDMGMYSWADRIKKVPVYSLCVFVIALVFAIWGNAFGGKIADYLNVTNVDVRPKLGVTVDIAKSTFKTEPLFGSGPNTFAMQWLSYKPADINSTIFWNTEFAYGVGLLPTFAVTTGIIGVLSWIVFFIAFLYFGFKALFSKVTDQFTLYLTASSFFISLYLWVMSCIYVPSIVICIFTFFFTGIFFATLYMQNIVSLKTITFSTNPRVGFGLTLGLVTSFVLVGLVGYGLFNTSKSLWYFQKSAYAANQTGDLVLSEQYIEKAIALVPYDVYYRAQSEIGVLKITTLLNQDLSKANKEEVQKFFIDELTKSITAGFNAQKADTKNYLNWITLGRAYQVAVPPETQVAGAYESAFAAYSKALEQNPQNPGILLLLAQLEASKNDLTKAKQYTIQAINQKQNYIDAYYLLAQLEVADKNTKGAIDSVTQASIIEPNNSAVFFQLGLLKYNTQDYAGAIDAFTQSLKITPDYANSKYFLGLSLVLTQKVPDAIQIFEELKKTNPDSKEVEFILSNLKAGKSPFANAQAPIDSKPESRQTPPVKEKKQ
jgi:tetratricopeptide (TPR) repeat protein